MIRKLFTFSSLAFLFAGGLSACGGSTPAMTVIDLDMNANVADLSVVGSTGDMENGPALGKACTTTNAATVCGAGYICSKFPVPISGGTADLAPAGYCTKNCTLPTMAAPTDSCAAINATCIATTATANFCMQNCTQASDCGTGLSCYLPYIIVNNPVPVCIGAVASLFTHPCDPTGTTGCTVSVTTDGGSSAAPGGCQRAAYGTGAVGLCNEICAPGTGTCGANSGSQDIQACGMTFPDSTDFPTDAFAGPVCTNQFGLETSTGTALTPIANGQLCNDPTATSNYYYNICADGLGCDLGTTGAGSHDKKCHPLCGLTGYSSTGVSLMGGTPLTTCPNGSTCTDVFGLLASSANAADKIGLCEATP